MALSPVSISTLLQIACITVWRWLLGTSKNRISFSGFRVMFKNFYVSLAPTLRAFTKVPPPAPAWRAASITVGYIPVFKTVTTKS